MSTSISEIGRRQLPDRGFGHRHAPLATANYAQIEDPLDRKERIAREQKAEADRQLAIVRMQIKDLEHSRRRSKRIKNTLTGLALGTPLVIAGHQAIKPFISISPLPGFDTVQKSPVEYHQYADPRFSHPTQEMKQVDYGLQYNPNTNKIERPVPPSHAEPVPNYKHPAPGAENSPAQAKKNSGPIVTETNTNHTKVVINPPVPLATKKNQIPGCYYPPDQDTQLPPVCAVGDAMRTAESANTNFNIMNKPSVSVKVIRQTLLDAESPVELIGDVYADHKDGAQYIWDSGKVLGVDPAVVMAIFDHESHYGTLGMARETNSVGNIRPLPDQPQLNGYRLYGSWQEGINDIYRLLRSYAKGGATTVPLAIPVWAPPSDDNDDGAYINGVEQDMTAMHAESVQNP